ncbi:unnamed protein product [Protopolystoma xenopodis]|uniref:Uncharacterized protein n=1 Tax=Protopolystoma xenopodis TaxID=117903 RepID=A0A3S5BY04_9PLAT|nr:unnamed protein product [Protopolystoma xenopodis]
MLPCVYFVRLYLSAAEFPDNRGLLVQAGAGKACLLLAFDSNTQKGQCAAAQTLARLAISMDPRVAFPGQRSLETVRPILQLLAAECTGLQNFEALLALTNLASLDNTHRYLRFLLLLFVFGTISI